MRTGYKMTKLGEIPLDWEVVKLEGICNEIFLGLTSKVDYVDEGGYPFVRATNISSGQLSFDEIKYISTEQHKKLTARRITKKGDVLVSKSGTLGTCAIVDVDIEFSTYESIITIQPKTKYLWNKFLFQILQDANVLRTMLGARVGGIVGHLNLKTFRKLNIPLPPLQEQKKIAEILSTVDEKIDLVQSNIEATQALKKGLMQQLLTKGIGHTKFKASKLGEIPLDWEVVKLLPHIELLTGFAFKSSGFNEEGEGIKLLRGINITVGRLRWNQKIDKWWNLPFEDYDKYCAKAGDLVISMDGSLVGRNYARVKEKDLPLLIVQRVACLRAKETLELEYLNQIIGSPLFINYVDAVKTSSGIPHISSKNIREFNIPLPPLQEQKKIAEILSTVDEKLDLLQEKKKAYQAMKKGLMQQLLTGQVRVKA